MTADISRFTATLKRVLRETKKTGAEIVTHACRDVAFRAASFTPKSSPGKINRDLHPNILRKMAAEWLAKKGKYTKRDLRTAMSKIKKKRKASVGALRAGWIPAIQQLGGTYRGATATQRGSSSKGFGKKATASNLRAHIRNTIVTRSHDGKHSADRIGVAAKALQKAIQFVSSDRQNHVRKKMMAKVLKIHSDK